MTKTLPTPNAGILDITPYVGGKSKAAAGVRVVKLSSNETPLGPSPRAKQAFIDASESLHRYPDGTASALREAIAGVFKLPAQNIVCGAGSDELIGLLVHGYVSKGEEVVISEHGFLMYKVYAQSVGAKVVVAPEKNLQTDVDAMLAAVTPKTKILFIANPNNPTGSYINKAELARLHAGLPSHVILAIDDAYSEYAEAKDYSTGSELVAAYDNVVMLRTFSKIYGLSALRLGWCYAPDAIVDVLNRIRGPFNVATAAMLAGIAAVEDVTFTSEARRFNNTQLAWLSSELNQLNLKFHPSIANFLLVEFTNAKAASEWLMERGLIVREVTGYGLPNHLRISIGLETDNRAVVAALTEFLEKTMKQKP